MFGIVSSAINAALGFLIRSVLVKFGLFFGLFFVTTGFIGYLTDKLPTAQAITNGLGGISPDIWYFLDLFAFSAGIPIILTAYVTRFAIRRIPFIG